MAFGAALPRHRDSGIAIQGLVIATEVGPDLHRFRRREGTTFPETIYSAEMISETSERVEAETEGSIQQHALPHDSEIAALGH